MEDETASIKVVVDEIWHTFDMNNDGRLNRHETEQFVREYMPEFHRTFVFSEEEFARIFDEIDKDGNGTVEKDEMAIFITRMMHSGRKKKNNYGRYPIDVRLTKA